MAWHINKPSNKLTICLLFTWWTCGGENIFKLAVSCYNVDTFYSRLDLPVLPKGFYTYCLYIKNYINNIMKNFKSLFLLPTLMVIIGACTTNISTNNTPSSPTPEPTSISQEKNTSTNSSEEILDLENGYFKSESMGIEFSFPTGVFNEPQRGVSYNNEGEVFRLELQSWGIDTYGDGVRADFLKRNDLLDDDAELVKNLREFGKPKIVIETDSAGTHRRTTTLLNTGSEKVNVFKTVNELNSDVYNVYITANLKPIQGYGIGPGILASINFYGDKVDNDKKIEEAIIEIFSTLKFI